MILHRIEIILLLHLWSSFSTNIINYRYKPSFITNIILFDK